MADPATITDLLKGMTGRLTDEGDVRLGEDELRGGNLATIARFLSSYFQPGRLTGGLRPTRILPKLKQRPGSTYSPRQTKSGLPVVKFMARKLDIEPFVRSLRRYHPYLSDKESPTDQLVKEVDLYGLKYLEGSGRPLKRKNIIGRALAYGQAEVLKKESPKRYRRIWNDVLRALWEGTPLRYITRPGKPPRINENLRGPASIRVSGIKIPAGSLETALPGLKKNILELKKEGFSYGDIIKDGALPAIYSQLDPYNEIVTESLHIMHQEYIRKFRKFRGKPSPRALRWGKAEEKYSARSDMIANLFYEKVAQGQRAEPEMAMLKLQTALGGGVYSHVAEHLGDITNRMSQHVFPLFGGWEAVNEKVNRALLYLEHPYGFVKETLENLAVHADVKGVSQEYMEKVWREQGLKYANAHSKIPVYNEVQKLARDAAIDFGRLEFHRAIKKLRTLKKYLGEGRRSWAKRAQSISKRGLLEAERLMRQK
jgi:hypothetical protein